MFFTELGFAPQAAVVLACGGCHALKGDVPMGVGTDEPSEHLHEVIVVDKFLPACAVATAFFRVGEGAALAVPCVGAPNEIGFVVEDDGFMICEFSFG